MPPILYSITLSPPVRAVLMFAKAIDLKLDIKNLDWQTKEHLSPGFLQINPVHTVPCLEDTDGFILWESHAIIPYLYSKYGKNDLLYPKDVAKRAQVDQRLHFDTGVAFHVLKTTARPLFQGEANSVAEENLTSLENVYGFIEAFLEGNSWIAGDFLSIADYSLLTTVSTMDVFLKVSPEKFPNVVAWLKRGEALAEYDVTKQGLILFKSAVRGFVQQSAFT